MAKLSALLGDELAKAKDKEKRNEIIKNHRESFRQIRQLFMSFGSLYQFPLLSTQQQSIEMYTLFRRHLDIDDFYRDLSTEIDTWDRVIAQHDQERSTNEVEQLTKVGLVLTRIGLPIAFVTLLLTWVPAWETLSGSITVTPHPLYWMLNKLSQLWPVFVIMGGPLLFVVFGYAFKLGIDLYLGRKMKEEIGANLEDSGCSGSKEEP